MKTRIWDWWKKGVWRLCIIILILISVPTIILFIGSGKFRYQYIIDFSYLIHAYDKFEIEFWWKSYSELDDLPIDQDFSITGSVYYKFRHTHVWDLKIDIISWELDRLELNTLEIWWNNFLDAVEPNIMINQPKPNDETSISCGNNWCFKYFSSQKEMPNCWLFRWSPRSYDTLEDEIQEWENPNNCKLILLPNERLTYDNNVMIFFRSKDNSEITLHVSIPKRKINREPFDPVKEAEKFHIE